MSLILRWHAGELVEDSSFVEAAIVAADSWLVRDGAVLAIDLHRRRFLEAVAGIADGNEFWPAAISAIPREGDWFPRVELQSTADGVCFVLHVRPAPRRARSVLLATHHGVDPRQFPTIKGPDTKSLLAARTAVQAAGAGEAVILSRDGWVVEGAYSALLWWRGDAICVPSPELERVDSVTARTVIALATALGLDVLYESVAPADLDGLEIWAMSALHGVRIVTGWIDGPAPAELPGRLSLWRTRIDRLARQLPDAVIPPRALVASADRAEIPPSPADPPAPVKTSGTENG